MEIEVLQGLNLESSTTTIKAHFTQLPDTQILDKLKSLHRVFMKDYQIFENTISVQSKLPHLWIEIFKTLERLTQNQISVVEARSFIFTEIIKKQILSMSTIPILDAADQQDLEITQYFVSEGIMEKPQAYYNRYYKIGCGRESGVFVSYSSSNDSHLGQKIQKDKLTSNIIFERLGLPIAQWQLVENREELKEIVNTFPKPFVLKPTGLVGGSGVSTGITTLEQAYAAYDEAKSKIEYKNRPTWQQNIMVQKQVEGEDYRILVIGGKARFATKRIPAYVVGDGIHNIRELIELLNKDPRRDTNSPLHTLKPIVFDEMLDQYLAEKGLTFETIPNRGEKVRIRKPASMSQGGITEDVTEIIHPQIMKIAETLAESIHVMTLGVDVFCKDITQPLTPENGTILEMNTMPEGYLNAFPTIGKQCPGVGHYFIEELLRNKEGVQKVVIIGYEETKYAEVASKLRLLESDTEVDSDHDSATESSGQISDMNNDLNSNIGLTFQGKIFVEGELFSVTASHNTAVESLKLNATLKYVIIAHEDMDSVKKNGLGFDHIDKLIIIGKDKIDMNTHQVLNSYVLENKIGSIVEM